MAREGAKSKDPEIVVVGMWNRKKVLLTLTNAIGTCVVRSSLESDLAARTTSSERSPSGSAMDQSKGISAKRMVEKTVLLQVEIRLFGVEGRLAEAARDL